MAAMDEVKSLDHRHDKVHPVSTKGGAGIREMQARRKSRHDAAVTDWHVRQREFYDQAEDLVLEAGRALRSDLASIDDRVDGVLDGLEDPARAMLMDQDAVTEQWGAVDSLEQERSGRADAFRAFLDGIEDRRCDE